MSFRQFRVPTSKSESHRVLALLHLNHQELNRLMNPSISRDTQLFIRNLESEESTLNFQDAGTPARIALAIFAFQGKKITLTGNSSLKKRPISSLVDVLNKLGAEIHYEETEGYFPCTVHGKINPKLIPENSIFEIDRTVSSQFVTALMLICSQMYISKHIYIQLKGKSHSNSYIEMTAKTLSEFQIPCHFDEINNCIVIQPQPPKFKPEIWIESDWSSALYGMQYVLARHWIITKMDEPWFFPQLQLPSLQGDSMTIPIFESLGLKFELQETGILCKPLRNYALMETLKEQIVIDCRNFPDAVPTLVNTFALAWYCNLKNERHQTPRIVFQGISNLITKESNRIEALNVNLLHFGFELTKVNEEDYHLNQLTTNSADVDDVITIKTYHDHRIAMSFAPWKLAFPQLQFDDVTCVEKSFPDFWNQINP